MQQPIVVCAGQGARDRLEVFQGEVSRQRGLPGDDMAQGAARHVLHDDEGAVVLDALVEHTDDVGAHQSGGGLRLGVEASDQLLVMVLVHELDGDHAT